MINDKTRNQEGGDNSANFQAETINQYGISYRDAKEIALDVFQQNFIILSEQAKQIARERAEELTNNFLNQIKEKNPDLLNSVKEPSMQNALYSAQKSYAISGDKDTAELIVDILVERAKQNVRNLNQLILDESLETASKLTIKQLDFLSLLLLCRAFYLIRAKRMDYFIDFFKGSIESLIGDFRKPLSFVEEMKKSFPGFEDEHFYYFLEHCRCIKISDSKQKSFKDSFSNNTHELLYAQINCMEDLECFWDSDSIVRSCNLTPVGEILAKANYKRRTGKEINLFMISFSQENFTIS